jgi:hypothetical protein
MKLKMTVDEKRREKERLAKEKKDMHESKMNDNKYKMDEN